MQKMQGTWRVVEIATDFPSPATVIEFITLVVSPFASAKVCAVDTAWL